LHTRNGLRRERKAVGRLPRGSHERPRLSRCAPTSDRCFRRVKCRVGNACLRETLCAQATVADSAGLVAALVTTPGVLERRHVLGLAWPGFCPFRGRPGRRPWLTRSMYPSRSNALSTRWTWRSDAPAISAIVAMLAQHLHSPDGSIDLVPVRVGVFRHGHEDETGRRLGECCSALISLIHHRRQFRLPDGIDDSALCRLGRSALRSRPVTLLSPEQSVARATPRRI